MKKIIALALALILTLTLAACSTGGDTPTGGNSTPGVTGTPNSSTPSGDNTNAPDTSSKPTETPSESNSPEPSATEVNKAADYEAGGYVEEYKASLDEGLATLSQITEIDVENTIDEIYQEYSEYLNVNITKDAIRVGISYGSKTSPHYKPSENITGISPDALNDVNDFLASKGETALDIKNPEQNIAALWLAASLFYDPDVTKVTPGNYNLVAFDIAMAFGLARADSSSDSAEKQADTVWSAYAALFDLY